MGREQKTKQERIHRRQLFDGKYTAEEVHRSCAFSPDSRCGGCGSPKVAIRCRVFAPLDFILQDRAGLAMHIASKNEGKLPVIDFKGPGGLPVKYVRIGDAYACDLCRASLEREAAKHPSYVVVHFDYGPGPEKTIIQVTR